MANKATTYTYAAGGAALLGLGYLMLRKKKQPLFITADAELDVYSGQMLTVRLVRGNYTMLGGNGLTLVNQVERGDMTDVFVIVNDANLPFTVTPTFIDQSNDNNQHTLTLHVQPIGEK